MSAIPTTFRAYVVHKTEGADGAPALDRGVREFLWREQNTPAPTPTPTPTPVPTPAP